MRREHTCTSLLRSEKVTMASRSLAVTFTNEHSKPLKIFAKSLFTLRSDVDTGSEYEQVFSNVAQHVWASATGGKPWVEGTTFKLVIHGRLHRLQGCLRAAGC